VSTSSPRRRPTGCKSVWSSNGHVGSKYVVIGGEKDKKIGNDSSPHRNLSTLTERSKLAPPACNATAAAAGSSSSQKAESRLSSICRARATIAAVEATQQEQYQQMQAAAAKQTAAAFNVRHSGEQQASAEAQHP
jgi:hypothetical protein